MSKSASKKKKNKKLLGIILCIIGIIILFFLVFFLGNKLTTKTYKSTRVPLSFTVPRYFPIAVVTSSEFLNHTDNEGIDFDTEFHWNAGSLYGYITVKKPDKPTLSLQDYVRLQQEQYHKNCPTQKPVECRFPTIYTYTSFGKYQAVTENLGNNAPTFDSGTTYYVLFQNGLLYKIGFTRRDPEGLKATIKQNQELGRAINVVVLSKDQQERAFKMVQDSIKF